MAKKIWTVQLADGEHTIQLEHGLFSNKRTISIDGQMAEQGQFSLFDFGGDYPFKIGAHSAMLHMRFGWVRYQYDVSLDGVSVTTQQPVEPLRPMPRWALIFIAACLFIPLFTLGGAVPATLGLSGAYACVSIARRRSWNTALRAGLSIGVTAVCWGLTLVALGTILSGRTLFNTQAAWREFTSTAGGYSVLMPGNAKEQAQVVDTATGKVDLYSATIDDRTGTYIAMYSDYPANITQGVDPQTLLDSSRDGAVASSRGQLINDRKISIDQYPGREIQVGIPPENGQSANLIVNRYYLVDQRLYQVMVVLPNAQTPSADALKFMDSFKLLKK
jgi:hypothetical protein